ncbi:MAG TPA: NfeD family protein [Candidatus Scatomonas merdavium]|nr:NfeD family protein [Candidatus Scatomonas merdavium]
MNPVIWLVILIVLLVIEVITLGLSTIWFAGGALASFIAALAGANVAVQVVLFLAVSIILLLFTRPVVMKYLNRNKTATNADSLIGEQAVVTQTINNLMSRGEVFINGMAWTARSGREDEVIEKDTVVRILRIDGVKLIVERKEGE